MSEIPNIEIDDKWILSKRGTKNKVDPFKPYAYLVEDERTASGEIEKTATIFLTNIECPFHCLMCDLWKNTTNEIVPAGTIPKQIEWALNHLPDAKHLKLYNSGNFFDKRAISPIDYDKIASLVSNFETLIIENHPKLINENCISFRDMIKPQLQIAMGLETVHPEILLRLNKHMVLEEFKDAALLLKQNSILSRAFILLGLPFLSQNESIHWAKESIDFAFNAGVECCVIIPARSGNGAMDYLLKNNLFRPPSMKALEEVMEYGITLNQGRIFSDLWDIEIFSDCSKCLEQRKNRLQNINLYQRVYEPVKCSCEV